MNDDWHVLFPSLSVDAVGPLSVPVLRRHGHDLLVLPPSGRLAARALTLYAAQTRQARWSKALLRTALTLGLPLPLSRAKIDLAPDNPVIQWLKDLTGETTFALLAGNPQAAGRRFIVLAFRAGRPAFVLKLGVSGEARALIEREAAFLQSVGTRLAHLPPLRETRRTDAWAGLVLDFIDGESPASGDTSQVAEILASWLNPGQVVPLGSLATWQRLLAHSRVPKLFDALAARHVTSTVFHGDFAPWNIRAGKSTRRWLVIDWERGESAGVPGWDWMHYVIQTGILVRRSTTAQSIDEVEALFRDPRFQHYAAAAGIAGLEKPLALAYLRYFLDVIRPTEGSPRSAELFQALQARWPSEGRLPTPP